MRQALNYWVKYCTYSSVDEGKKYTIPRKGTDDYSSGVQIMRTLQSERPKKEPNPRESEKEIITPIIH